MQNPSTGSSSVPVVNPSTCPNVIFPLRPPEIQNVIRTVLYVSLVTAELSCNGLLLDIIIQQKHQASSAAKIADRCKYC